MKKLFCLLFIGSIVLASCNKDANEVQPIQVNCDCGDSLNVTIDSLNVTNSTNSTVDPNLVGHWKLENVPNNATGLFPLVVIYVQQLTTL